MSQLFTKKMRGGNASNAFKSLVGEVRQAIDDSRSSMGKPSELTRMIGLESLDDNQVNELNTALESLQRSFSSVAKNHAGFLGGGEKAAMEDLNERVAAASVAQLIAGDVESFIQQRPVVEGVQVGRNETFVGTQGVQDALAARIPAFEDYEEKDNRNVVVNTVTYNLAVSRQSTFGEAFFPTVTVSPDNLGVAVSIRLVSVFDDFKHGIDGSLAQFNKKNIVKALIDSTILKNEQTRIVPVYRTESAAAGMFATGFTATDRDLEGEIIPTAPLAIGKELNLLGLSQTAATLDNGTMDRTDTIDPAVYLDNVYVKFGDDIIKFNVSGLSLNNFVVSSQDNYRRQNLNFHTESLVINKDRKDYAGAALVDLAAVSTNNYVVQIGLSLTGYVNIERGDTLVSPVQLKLISIHDADTNTVVPTNAGPGQAIKTLIDGGTILGYDLNAYRTNANRRQRGQLLDTTYYSQIWAVPLRAPISVLRPVHMDAQTDSSDLAALVSATHARTSNEAVTTLINTAAQLQDHVANRIPGTNAAPDLFGVARMLLDPTFIGEDINVRTAINSISSSDKGRDLQALLVDKIRNIAYRLYRDSGYQAVVESQAAGVSGNPTLILGTDPLTARYLLVDGEPRLGGEGFDHLVVTSPDKRIEGKIFIALGYPNEKSGGGLNPLHFGNMLWSPELVLVLPISRNGQVSKELTVQPRFRHIVNVPVMGLLNVTGIDALMKERVEIDFNEV